MKKAMLLGLGFVPLSLLAGEVVPAKSELVAVFSQMGVPVEGRFKQLSGEIQFDPAKIEQATAKLSIDMGSFDLGSEEYNAEVAKADWFNQPKFPTASFVSRSLKPLDKQQLQLTGDLSIKGKTQSVSLPVKYQPQGSGYQFEGELPISRLQFLIGEGEWQQTDLVADQVKIRFKLVTAN